MSPGVLITVLVVALCGPALLWLGGRTAGPDALRSRLRYQAAAVPFAVGVWLAIRLLVPEHGSVAAVGDLGATVASLGWLGVGEQDTWGTLLLTTGAMVAAVTALVLWLQVGRGSGTRATDLARVLPWAVLIAILNATAEELIFRVALIEGLTPAMQAGAWSAGAVAIVSGILFGLPHWFGHPSGPVGVLLAGFLGWLSAMATIQTGGIAWAWLLHVVLDVIILATVLGVARSARSVSTVAVAA